MSAEWQRSRVALAACVVALALACATARAQDAEVPPPVDLGTEEVAAPRVDPAQVVAPEPVDWPSSEAPPGPSVHPRRVQREHVGRLVGGSVLFGLGYAGAVTWSVSVFANVPLGVLSCNDTYAGLMLVPVLGPPIALGAAAGCAGLRFEEVLLPVLTSAAQLVGLITFLVGLAGDTYVEYDAPVVTLSVDASGAAAGVAGRF